MARLASVKSGARVGKGTIRTANRRGPGSPPISGIISGARVHGAGARGTMAGLVGTGPLHPLAGNMTFGRAFHRGARVRSSVLQSGQAVARGLENLSRMETATVGGAAVVGGGALAIGAFVEHQHSKKALTAAQLQQRRLAARSHRTHLSGRP